MEESNVHETEPSNRDDLKHEDKVATRTPQEMPEAAIDQDRPATLEPRGSTRFDDDVPDDNDLLHPSPTNEPLGRAPGM